MVEVGFEPLNDYTEDLEGQTKSQEEDLDVDGHILEGVRLVSVPSLRSWEVVNTRQYKTEDEDIDDPNHELELFTFREVPPLRYHIDFLGVVYIFFLIVIELDLFKGNYLLEFVYFTKIGIWVIAVGVDYGLEECSGYVVVVVVHFGVQLLEEVLFCNHLLDILGVEILIVEEKYSHN